MLPLRLKALALIPADFVPSYRNLQADIERYLTSVGQREITKGGFIVFRDYEEALPLMFGRYIDHGILNPLVDHFRRWNWEFGDNDYLLQLTDQLVQTHDWE